jgi:competence protein ComEC
MRPPYHIPFWKTAPITRLLIPLVIGIIIQWYLQFTLLFILVCIGSFATAFILVFFLPVVSVYLFKKVHGLIFHFLIISTALLLTWQKDSRHHPSWYGHYYKDSSVLLVKVNEIPVEKSRSYKAEGIVTHVINGDEKAAAFGKVLLYFSKDSVPPALQYGDIILIGKKVQAITNSGNPGAFNYKRYAAFQQLYHQLFLQDKDWLKTGYNDAGWFQSFLFSTRSFVLDALTTNIGNANQELGIAEALLIGYKEDLDKDLVQAYSNTGVVHIIAISGLHLGLIFFVLTWVFNRVPWLKQSRHIKVILLLGCLWLFSLLTGGSASVLRSAVMFSVIVIGKYYFRQSSIYNSLAASAFLLLSYNPYYLWDVGFELSYLAVIGIVALQEPIYRLIYFKNVMVRKLWNMISITLAAQVATFPVCIYYFHQFPNLFLFTNLLTVPLSTAIIFGEIFLVIVSAFHWLATYTGIVVTWFIYSMNRIILFFDGFSFSLVDHIYANIISTWLLYALVVFSCGWLLHKNKYLLRVSLICLAGFSAMHAFAKIKLQQQRKMVIYNVAKCRAVDFIVKNEFVFVGDSSLKQESLLQNFHLKPARLSMQVSKQVAGLRALQNKNFYFQFYNKKMIFLDSTLVFEPARSRLPIDVLLISNNPAIKISDIVEAVSPAIVVFDGSNSLWKIENWKKECEELNLRFHSVSEQGAFILEVGD